MPKKTGLWAIEIKRGLTVNLGKGFHNGRADLKPTRSFVVYSGEKRYPISSDVEVIGVRDMATLLETSHH